MEETLFNRTCRILELSEDSISKARNKVGALNMNWNEPEVITLLNNQKTEELLASVRNQQDEQTRELRGILKQSTDDNITGLRQQIASAISSEVKPLGNEFRKATEISAKMNDTLNGNFVQFQGAFDEACKKMGPSVARAVLPVLQKDIQADLKIRKSKLATMCMSSGAVLGVMMLVIGYVLGQSVDVAQSLQSSSVDVFVHTLSPYTMFGLGIATVFALWIIVNLLRQHPTTRKMFGLNAPEVK